MKNTMTHTFYKDQTGWYIDLPEFFEKGLGTKDNLAMVAGADTYLDILSGNSDRVTLELSIAPFEGATEMIQTKKGADFEILNSIGHPIQFGAYKKM